MSEQTLRILLVEDNPGDALLVETALNTTESDLHVERAERLAAARDILSREPFDIVLLDLTLPDSQGLPTVEAICADHPDTPVVVLTGLADDNKASRAIEAGAQDYVVKGDMIGTHLHRSIRYAIQRQLAAAERERLLAELRTANELIQHKNQRLAELYETAQQFVDNVSHEFRTPLTVIKEFASILCDELAGPLNDEQREYLGIVLDRVNDLSLMVSDMLDISKLEAGLFGMRRKPTELEEILEHIRPMLTQKAQANKVALTIDPDADLPALFCDGEKIGRVIVNLVINAIKFANEGGTIEVRASYVPKRSEVVIQVCDDGPGIDGEHLSAIFERFHQVPADVKSSRKGFGLGLSIVRDLVHLSFGTVSVDSRPGAGSTFSFSVPTAVEGALIERYVDWVGENPEEVPAVSLVSARIGAGNDRTMEAVDDFLRMMVRSKDLLFRTGEGAWMLVAACTNQELAHLIERVHRMQLDANRNRPGELLPELQLDALGTWRVPDERAALAECFGTHVDVEAPAHA